METPEIVSLVEKAKDGDEPSFARLYEEFVTPIYRFIYVSVRNKEETEDLTQQVFIKVFEHLQSFDNTKASFKTWLYQIAKNTIIDAARKKKSVVFAEPEDEYAIADQKSPGTEALAREKETRTHVLQLLDTLEPHEREIIALKFMEERSNKEIADITGKTEVAIRKTQSRALAKLRTISKTYD